MPRITKEKDAPRCPQCNKGLDAATELFDEKKKPMEGDLSICFTCGCLLMFTSRTTFRKLTDKDMAEIQTDAPLTAQILLNTQEEVVSRKR